jgi:hypothetical protein
MIEFPLRELKPKEIRLFPDELVFNCERGILERTVLHGWVKQWLKWVHWYHSTAYDPYAGIEQLLDAPIQSSSWKRSEFDPSI